MTLLIALILLHHLHLVSFPMVVLAVTVYLLETFAAWAMLRHLAGTRTKDNP